MNGDEYQYSHTLTKNKSVSGTPSPSFSHYPKNYYPAPLTHAAPDLDLTGPPSYPPHNQSGAHPLPALPHQALPNSPYGSPRTLSSRAFNSNGNQFASHTNQPSKSPRLTSPLPYHGYEPPLPPLPPLAKSHSQQNLVERSSPIFPNSRFYVHHNQTEGDITRTHPQLSHRVTNRQKRMGVVYGFGATPDLLAVSKHQDLPIPPKRDWDFSDAPQNSVSPRPAATTDSSVPLPHSLVHKPQSSSNFAVSNLGARPNKPGELSPIDVRVLSLNPPDSAPSSSTTTTYIRDLITPPTPLTTSSVPQSPRSPSMRAFPMPKLFGSLKSQSRSSKSRADSPSLASRIGSSISMRFGSRFGSRASTRESSPTHASASGDGMVEKFASSVVSGVDDGWPEFSPRRLPTASVVLELGVLGSIHGPLVDIDAECQQAPLNVVNLRLTPEDEIDIRGFLARGVYYYQREGGTADEMGNYQQVRGEQIGYRYRVESLLGRGSFGTVLKCRDHKSGRMVAVKVTASRRDVQTQSKIEANLLRALVADHSGKPEDHHFVRFLEYFKFRGHLCIVTELLGPNLYELLKRGNFKGLEENSVRYITRQLCEGLEFLSEHQIIHCDLKPENVLVSDIAQCQVKIVDFGSSCYEGKRLYTYIQSRFYRAPEILLGMPYSCEIDMWSLGTIVPELLLGRPLLPSVDENDQVALMAQVIGPLDTRTMRDCSRAHLFFRPNGDIINLRNAKGVDRGAPGSTPISMLLKSFSADAIDFVEKILEWSPQKRLAAKRAVYHSFVLAQ